MWKTIAQCANYAREQMQDVQTWYLGLFYHHTLWVVKSQDRRFSPNWLIVSITTLCDILRQILFAWYIPITFFEKKTTDIPNHNDVFLFHFSLQYKNVIIQKTPPKFCDHSPLQTWSKNQNRSALCNHLQIPCESMAFCRFSLNQSCITSAHGIQKGHACLVPPRSEATKNECNWRTSEFLTSTSKRPQKVGRCGEQVRSQNIPHSWPIWPGTCNLLRNFSEFSFF